MFPAASRAPARHQQLHRLLIPHPFLSFFFFWRDCLACGILVSWPGIQTAPPALEVWRLKHWIQGSPPASLSYRLCPIRWVQKPCTLITDSDAAPVHLWTWPTVREPNLRRWAALLPSPLRPFLLPLRAAAWPLVSRWGTHHPFPPGSWPLSSLV